MKPEFFTFGLANQEKITTKEVVPLCSERLEVSPSFVAVGLAGSHFKGYETEDSDLDLLVVYDQSREGKNNLEAELSEEKDLANRVGGLTGELEKLSGKEVHVDPISLRSLFEGPLDYFVNFEALAALCYDLEGAKVDHYRSIVQEKLEQLSESEKDEVVERTLRLLMLKDTNVTTLGKLIERRIVSDEVVYRKERRSYWVGRIKKVFGYNLEKLG